MADVECFFDCSSPWTYLAFTNIQLPSLQAHQLANAAADVTLVFLLVLIFAGRLLSYQSARQTARMAV